MFLWVFVAALISSQVSHLYRRTFMGLDDFTISGVELKEWISQLDSSARAHAGGAGSSRRFDEVDSDFDYWISADTVNAEQVLSHLQKCVRTKASAGGWTIVARGAGGDGFDFFFSKRISRFRIYCWTIPTDKSPLEEQLARQGKNVFRIKVLQIGYTQR